MVGGIFCDLQKAFDSVNYDILLSKLEYYAIRDIAKAFYQSYLQNRYQRVSLCDKDIYKFSFSKRANIKCGILQGSILGPLSFLIYMLMIYQRQ